VLYTLLDKLVKRNKKPSVQNELTIKEMLETTAN